MLYRPLVIGVMVVAAMCSVVPAGATRRPTRAVAIRSDATCWQQSAVDSQHDAQVDVAGYSLALDCGAGKFTFTYTLAPTSGPPPLVFPGYPLAYAYVRLWLTVPGETGCDGFARVIAGSDDPAAPGHLIALLADVRSCNPNTWRILATGTFGPPSVPRTHVLTFPASAIGDGDFEWWAEVSVTGDPAHPPDRLPDGGGNAAEGVPNYPHATSGYWLTDAAGHVFPFGNAHFFGDLGTTSLAAPVVGIAATPSRNGYWLLGRDGGVFSYGTAAFHGSTGAMHLNRPVEGITPTQTGRGYWFVASDGGIFSFGDARFFGSTGAIHLNQPIVGMAATPTGQGYWLVAADGGIFSFGDARFFGSTGAIHLNRPIVAMAPTKTGHGYWLVASDGGVFAFGDARFFGSTGALRLARPITAMSASPTGNGYRFVASDGGTFSFGDAPFYGSLATVGVSSVIAIAG